MVMVQVWAIPPLNLSNWHGDDGVLNGGVLINTPIPITMREVDYKQNNGQTRKILLFEREDPRDGWADQLESFFSPIATVIERVSYAALTRIRPFAGRLIALPRGQGDPCRSMEFDGAPPGLMFSFFKFEQGRQGVIDTDFFAQDLPDALEGAISWYVSGMHAIQPQVALMCFWLGIEMLSPMVCSPIACPKCKISIPECPECGGSTDSNKATKSITEHLKVLGLSGTQASKLYDQRSYLVHGRVKLDDNGTKLSAEQAELVGDLLMKGIKTSLNWRQTDAPRRGVGPSLACSAVELEHQTAEGLPLDFPVIAAGWERHIQISQIGELRGIDGMAGMSYEFGA